MPLIIAKWRIAALCVFALLLGGAAVAEESRDALAPKSTVDEALALPLHVVTIATRDLDLSRKFYVDGWGMQVDGPLPISRSQRIKLTRHWQLPVDLGWEVYHLHRAGVDGVAHIRLLVLDRDTPHIHKSWNALELGPFSMGFPNEKAEWVDKHLRDLGFDSLNKMEVYPVPRTDGSTYMIYETIFNGPDFVHAVNIQRGDGMAQLGPVADNGLGGPGYSAQVIEDSDKVLGFYQEVLGMELRSDRHWKSAGSEGALNVPDGTEFRFSIVYSKGATSGHLLFVDFMNREPINTGVPPRLPNRGIGLWTFPVTDLDQVLVNANLFGSEVVSQAKQREFPILGKVRSASLMAPNGFVVEVFEQAND